MLKLRAIRRFSLLPIGTSAVLLLAACGDTGSGDDRLRLQTDWYAQPEHGGHYQALATGLYEDAGLDVDILEGGPNALPLQRVAGSRVEFGFSRADDVITAIDRGMPLVMVAAYLQHDPQALMLHAGDPAESWSDLDGRRVMAMPGSAWIDYLEHTHGIELEIVSLDYGLGRFLADPEMIQQCFVSNQPFHARREGAEVETWLIADSGYDPPHVVFTHRDFLENHPETVAVFVEASIRGWEDYLDNDPAPADSLILGRNAQMSPEFIAFAREILTKRHLVTGDPEEGAEIGRLDPGRMATLLADMRKIGLIESDLTVDEVMADVLALP